MTVKQKLQAQRGATIMAALLFFLVASVCGSIILAAATATLSRITTQAEDARAYYSLTSAAQLVRDDLLQSHWKVTKTITAGTSTYTVSALDADGNVDAKTFIPDLLSDADGAESSPVFKNTDNIEIKTTASGDTLPLVYARPNPITFKTLFDNYDAGANTQLRILLTNDPEGFDESGNQKFRNTYNEGNKTRQVYWLELTLDSVKIPAGYVNMTDKDGNGSIEFQIGWDNAEIQKLERTIPTTP